MGPDQIVMIIVGAASLIAGLTLLRLRHAPAPPRPDDGAEPAREPQSRVLGLSEPSRLTIGVVLLVVGYHLVMWAIPAPWASAVVIPTDRWYFLAAGAAVAVAASLLLDRTSSWRREG